MREIQSVLCPVDFSQATSRQVDFATDICRLFGARLVIPERTLLPYFYPLPAAALLLTALFGIETGMAVSIVLAVLSAYGLPNALELMPYYLFSSLVGLLLLGQARRFWAFLRAGNRALTETWTFPWAVR